jgi:ADP-ribose pyrophosphatase
MTWKIRNTTILEKNNWITLRKDQCQTPSGHIIDDYYVMELQDVACAIAITKEKKILLIKEYKHGVKKRIVQLPCGYIDAGETPMEAAKRELLEETGYVSEKWTSLGENTGSPGRLNHYYHFFVAEDVERVQDPRLEVGEEAELMMCSFDEAEKVTKKFPTDLVTPTGLFIARKYF